MRPASLLAIGRHAVVESGCFSTDPRGRQVLVISRGKVTTRCAWNRVWIGCIHFEKKVGIRCGHVARGGQGVRNGRSSDCLCMSGGFDRRWKACVGLRW